MARLKAKPRKQPKQLRAGATVEAILGAAAEAFRDLGFAKASVNAIAARAGVSVGSLYQYYPSKEALLGALATRHTQGVLAELEAALTAAPSTPLEETVGRVVERMVAFHADPLERVLARGLDDLGGAIDLQAEIDLRAGAAVEQFLRARGDEIRPSNHRLAALLLVRSVDLLTHAAVERAPESLEDGTLARELTALVLGYLRPPARSTIAERESSCSREAAGSWK